MSVKYDVLPVRAGSTRQYHSPGRPPWSRASVTPRRTRGAGRVAILPCLPSGSKKGTGGRPQVLQGLRGGGGGGGLVLGQIAF